MTGGSLQTTEFWLCPAFLGKTYFLTTTKQFLKGKKKKTTKNHVYAGLATKEVSTKKEDKVL